MPWFVDIGKEIVMSLLSMGVGAIYRSLRDLLKDVNAYFARTRALEERVSKLEKGETK